MKIHKNNNPTIVSALGKVIHTGREGDGLIIVDESTQKPIMATGEVSDDETVQMFFHLPKNAALRQFDPANPEDTVHEVLITEDGIFDQFEVLIQRADHQPLRRVQVEMS